MMESYGIIGGLRHWASTGPIDRIACVARMAADRRGDGMQQSVMVLGAGMVGVSVAVHLRRRGLDVVLLDRQGPGEGTSFGNAGLIQREAVFPHPFPRGMAELLRIAGNRSIDAAYHRLALPGLASPLLRYWWHSEPGRYAQAVQGHAALIKTCLDEHMALARDAGATALLRPIGYLRMFGKAAAMEAALVEADQAHQAHGVNYTVLDAAALAAAEPALQVQKLGAIHWTDPYSVSDPHGLTSAYAKLFAAEGGVMAIGDASTLTQVAGGWRVQTDDGPIDAARIVVALGPASGRVTQRFGYTPPLFGKRGYHMHYGLRGNAVLNRPILDNDSGFMMGPAPVWRSADHRRRIRSPRCSRHADPARAGGAGGAAFVAAGGAGRQNTVDGRAPLHAGHAADHRQGAWAGRCLVRVWPCPSGADIGSKHGAADRRDDDWRRAFRRPGALPGRALGLSRSRPRHPRASPRGSTRLRGVVPSSTARDARG